MSETNNQLLTRCKLFLQFHANLIVILFFAAVVWCLVFSIAASDYILMQRWNGAGQIDIFGLTVNFQFEGWADYSFYYQTWGERFLNGYVPYTDAFEYVTPEDYVPYFFPPLYVYLCALGNSLPFDPFGTAVLICLFGYATAFPIYGIANYLSQNRRVGEIAAATYLLNPLILFHTTYDWLNPAPFVFFVMMSFYLLMKQRRLAGTLAMVTAALFKQTAMFMALPLIAYLLRAPPSSEPLEHSESSRDDESKVVGDELDLPGFLKLVIIVLVFAIAISFPYIIDFENYIFYIFLKPGVTLLRDVTILPASNSPVTFAVLFIVLGTPEPLTQLTNIATAYSIFLIIGIILTLIPMLLEVKDDLNLPGYWRRMLFFTLLMLLSVHILSPRGIYKYYLVALIPFFSIVSSERMLARSAEKVKASLPMITNPLFVTLLILILDRYVYIGLLILVLLAYIFCKQFGQVYGLVSEPLTRMRKRAICGIRH